MFWPPHFCGIMEIVTKQEQFLLVVQTAILANGINLAADPTLEKASTRHVYSATGVLGMMDDALYASERIPESMTAFEAAHEFCYFMIGNLRETEESAGDSDAPCPAWFART